MHLGADLVPVLLPFGCSNTLFVIKSTKPVVVYHLIRMFLVKQFQKRLRLSLRSTPKRREKLRRLWSGERKHVGRKTHRKTKEITTTTTARSVPVGLQSRTEPAPLLQCRPRAPSSTPPTTATPGSREPARPPDSGVEWRGEGGNFVAVAADLPPGGTTQVQVSSNGAKDREESRRSIYW